MRLCRSLCPMVLTLALAACAGDAGRDRVAMRASIDDTVYGAPIAQPRYAARETQYVPSRRTTLAPGEAPYRLDAGDRLRVVVFGQDTLSNTYAVDANGAVAMPLIGQVNARGLTTQQLSSAIAGRLRKNYIRDPSVAVEVETHRPFFIMGEVTFPGQYPFVARMTVQTAVAIAGGFTPRASEKTVTVTRKIEGIPRRFTQPLHYPILPGDTITVGERWF